MAGLPKEIPFTQVPNCILDEKLKDLKSSELKVLMLICRKTFGYQKLKDSISLSQLTKHTGLAKNTVIEAVKGLEKKKVIKKHTNKITHQYSIIIEPPDSSTGSINEPTEVQNSDLTVDQNLNTQKKPFKQNERNTTTISSSDFSDEVFEVVEYWNSLFDTKIVSVDDRNLPLIAGALQDFTKDQLCQAMKNRSVAGFYENRYPIKHNPKSFFGYPQTIRNDLQRDQRDLLTYNQVVDRITSGKNKDSDFVIVPDKHDKNGHPMRRLVNS